VGGERREEKSREELRRSCGGAVGSASAMEVPQAFADVLERVLLPEDKIRARVAELGQELSSAYAGKHLVLLGVLTGSFMFAADLSRAICLQHEVHFMKASSYKGTQSTGSVAISGLEVSCSTNSSRGLSLRADDLKCFRSTIISEN